MISIAKTFRGTTGVRRKALALAAMTALGVALTSGASAVNPSTALSANPYVVAAATSLRAGDVITGSMNTTRQSVHIAVALRLRNRAELDNFIAAGGAERAAGGIEPMSADQLNARHLPTQEQAQQVADYLTQAGFRNVEISSNRMLVTADGTAAVVESAFLTNMVQVTTREGRLAYANTSPVNIPAALQESVLSVIGLQTVHQYQTFARAADPNAVNAITGHFPNEFSSIYGGNGVATAAGVTVGIITQGSLAQTITDLNSFTSAHGFATVTTQTVNTGGTSTDTSGVGEWNMDSQAIVGMAGGQVGKIIFYNEPTLQNSALTANINTAVTANAAKIINMSLGECETAAQADGSAAADDQLFATGVAQGQTFSISTGDSGANECSPDPGTKPSNPANSPYVIAASGTRLDASTTTWNSETVWSGSGGSESTYEPKPSWQTLWSGTHRGVADIAFDGDPNSGAKVIVNGANQQIGGTSLSAPIFAGMWARVIAVKGTSVGFAGPLIYALPASDFHDITSGSNGISAGVGYDLASGRGAMILNTAINHIGTTTNTPPVANFSVVTSGLTANFTDSSTDSDGTIASRSWNFGDSSTATSTNPSHTYATAGTKTVTLTVTDNGGATNTKTSSVTVSVVTNTPPVANFSVATSGLVATFTDSSTDADGTIASRSWNFGDSTTSTATSPSHTYAAAGTYSVALTVTDNGGATNTKTSSVTVTSSGCGGTVLCNGVAVTGLAAATGAYLNYTMVVPAGASSLKFVIAGGTGDADMYVKFGSAPTDTVYDCRPFVSGNAETCNIATAQAGTYYVRLKGYTAFSGVSLTGSYSTVVVGPFFQNTTALAIPDLTTVTSNIVTSGISGAAPATLKVAVNITHTYIGDLKIDLIAPNGTVFNIWNRTGGSTQNINQTFTVNASAITAPNGTWKLQVADQAAGDSGTLNSWSLQF